MKKIILLAIVAIVTLTGVRAQGQQVPAIPLDPAVKMGVLPNGLTYYIRHNEWPEKRCDFYIAQKVGSMQEEDDQRGLAHFLEHMCFNGTTHFPGDALKQYLERIGVKFGENLNAYTSFDETVYNINNVNVEIPGSVDSCLMILHDWSHDLLLEGKEIDKERGVINEEWRMRRSAMMRMQEEAFKTLYQGSKYAERMPIGTMDIVMNFPYEAIRSYYRRWYRPDLQALVVVGDVDVAEIEQKLQAMFADIQAAPADAAKREYFPVPDNESPIVSIQKDKEQPASIALIMCKSDPLPREMKSSMQYLMFLYTQNAIESMLDERISEIMQQADAPFAQAGIGFGSYLVAKTKNAVSLQVIMKDGRYLEGIKAIYREWLRAQRGGFTAGEYERFKQEYLSKINAAYEARNKVENTAYVQEYVRHFLDNEPAAGIELEKQVAEKMTEAVPLAVLNQSMSLCQMDKNIAIALFMPDKEGIQAPSEQEIAEALKQVEAENIEAKVEEINTDPLVPELTSNVRVKSIKDDSFGARLVTLSNGIKVHVLKTDYAPNQIMFKATSWGGNSLYGNDEYLNSANTALVSVGGLGAFSATELNKKLAGIQAGVQAQVSDRFEGLEGSSVKKDLETMLQLTYLSFTSPRRDDDAFQSAIERTRNALKNMDLRPQTTLSDSIASVLYNNHIRARRTHVEDLEKLNYDRILDIYKERFANARDFEFFLVGDVDADSVAPLLAKYLGALPIKGKTEKYKRIDLRLAKGERTCIFDKEQDTPNAIAVFTYHAPLKDNLRNDIMVDMLQQSMSMLYTETVREDEGGAYGVPVSCSLLDYPEAIARVTIQLPTSPEKLDRMTQVVYDGVDQMCTEGPSEDFLQKIKEYMIRSHAENLKDNNYWMNSLYTKARYGQDYVTGYDDVVKSITAADLRNLAQKIFRSGNRLVVGMKTPTK